MPGPVRITGSLGSGVTSTLAERADALAAVGESVLVLSVSEEAAVRWVGRRTTATTFLSFALELTGRRLVSDEERLELVGDEEVATAILRYQASFLGREELLAHADAVGDLELWDDLDRITQDYLRRLADLGAVDAAGAVVAASMLLREPGAAPHYDHIVVDDWQQATFATNRLLTQLAGGASVVVGGHLKATLGESDGASATYLESFLRRFGTGEDIELDSANRRRPADPELMVVQDERAAVADLVGDDGEVLVPRRSMLGIHPRARLIDDVIGLEWPEVVIAGCTEGVFPGPPPAIGRHDPHLFGGPDVPTAEQRIEAAAAEDRRRFAVACTRATQRLVFTAVEPVSPFVADLQT